MLDIYACGGSYLISFLIILATSLAKSAKEVWQEEASEDGRNAERNEILDLIKQGYNLADIENMLKARL